ncbi:Slp family lipoprotein [Pasteurellaceae bacterium LIM206]|nr:Slp family lipoprotein [Pasteurellaceae bacterium LIM206]
MKKLLILPLIAMLSACVTTPKGLEKNEFTIQSMKQIEAEDYACKCKQIRLGGKVIAATALKTQTRVEVMSLPVASYSAKPLMEADSDGRFVAYLNGFVDPADLKNQYITVSGTLKGKEKGSIDQAEYDYPVIQVKAYKRWHLAEAYRYDDWDYGWGPWGGMWGPWGSRWYHRPSVIYYLY